MPRVRKFEICSNAEEFCSNPANVMECLKREPRYFLKTLKALMLEDMKKEEAVL